MPSAGDDASDLLSLLGGERAAEAEIEQLGVSDDGVQRSAQLVTHHRQEIRLRLIRFLGLGAHRLLALDLTRLFRFSAADLAQTDELRRVLLPRRLDDAHLGDDGEPVTPPCA